MLHLFTSLDYYTLSNQLIQKVQENWKDPFCSPVIVFPDSKVEKWFKLNWIKKSQEKNFVLMNLNSQRMEAFLFEILKQNDDEKIEVLTGELLRNLIITKLSTKNDEGGEGFYFNKLNSAEVNEYLLDDKDKSKLNEFRLFDFAKEMAGLFVEYQTTRSENFLTGWQKTLYEDVVGDGVEIDGIKYLTVAQLYYKNKKQNNGKAEFNWNEKIPVFLFGFSSVGQIYRSIFKAFSEKFQLFVFLQTSENSSSEFIDKLGKYGKTDFELWCSSKDAIEGLDCFTKPEVTDFSSIKTPIETSLTSAPSKIREIEVLHSKICRLLKKENVSTGNILVLAPNIHDYKIAISQVFDQVDEDNPEYSYIPYSIVDYSSQNSLMSEAITILFDILEKGYLCRADFITLIRNAIVQNVRHFSEDKICIWIDWIVKMNVFRDRGSEKDGNFVADWEKAKNRLLLSRVTDNIVAVAGEEYLPFSDLASADNEYVYQFIDAVDEIEKWITFSEKKFISKEDMDALSEILDKWLLVTSAKYNAEAFIYQQMKNEIHNQKKLLEIFNLETISAKCFSLALLSASEGASYSKGTVFTSGITFMNFKPNRILPADYVFILGLDSKSMPGLDKANILDLRKTKELGDDSIPAKNKNAFLCQLFGAKKGFYLSYVNKNLQKDEDFYRSSVVEDFVAACEKINLEIKEEKISIDETRNWEDLYTPREFRNKINVDRLYSNTGGKAAEEIKAGEKNQTLPDRVSVSALKNFLEEPFKFMIMNMFQNEEEDDSIEQEEYEPLCIENLSTYNLLDTFIEQSLLGTWNKEAFVKDLKLKNQLPDSYFGDEAVNELIETGQGIIETIQETYPEISSFDFEDKAKTQIVSTYKIDDEEKTKEWNLSGALCWHNTDFETSKTLQVLDVKSKFEDKHYLSAYVSSLAVLSKAQDKNFSYTVVLDLFNQARTHDSVSFSMTPKQAEAYIDSIYKAAFIEKYKACIPISKVRAKEDEEPYKFSTFTREIKEDNIWKYFSKAFLFDENKDFGYSQDDQIFNEEWQSAREHQRSLIKFVQE